MFRFVIISNNPTNYGYIISSLAKNSFAVANKVRLYFLYGEMHWL